MYYFFLLVVLFSCNVVCEDCMTFSFQNEHEDFNNEVEACESLDMWNFGKYSELTMDGFHPKSSVFATPLQSLSCMSSPIFQMRAGGTLEINLYLKPNVQTYQIVVFVLQYIEDGMDANVLTQNLILTEGWQSVNLTVAGFDVYLGYVALMALTDPQESLLLDSLRYFAPSFEELCLIYQEYEDTATTTVTPTPTPTETSTFTPSEISTPTDTPADTPTPSEISSPTSTPNEIDTSTPTNIPTTDTRTETPTFTPTNVPTPTATETETPTSMPTETTTPSEIPTSTPTSTQTETLTNNYSDISTNTANPTEPSTSTPTETSTTITTETPTVIPSEISTPNSAPTESPSSAPDSSYTSSSEAYTNTNLTSVTDYSTSTINSEDTDTQDTTFFETTTETGTTDNPTLEDKTPFSFWNAYTITMVTVLSLIILLVIAFTSYRIGKRRTEADISHVILSESEDLPPPFTVPRVTGVYSSPSKSNTLHV